MVAKPLYPLYKNIIKPLDRVRYPELRYIMMEDYKKEDFDRLKNEVETLVGRKIVSPRDFDFLSRQIEGYTQETVSVSTLKRLWGYVACSCKPSRFNLELLSPAWWDIPAGMRS